MSVAECLTLSVYNLPYSVDEVGVQSIFPTAKTVDMAQQQSHGVCVLQFRNATECEEAFNDCLQGKQVGGSFLRAEYGIDQYRSHSDRNKTQETNDYDRGSDNNSCTLMLSNLPYSATERDVQREFRRAINVEFNLDERGNFKGVAYLTFSSPSDCSSALNECNHKMMNGRAVRGRICQVPENSSRSDSRGKGRDNYRGFNGQRNYGHRDYNQPQNHGGQRSGNFNRSFGNQGRNNDNRDRDRDRQNIPSRYGSRDNGKNDSFGQQRQRSPQAEPIRGYGSNRGPRITSAVVHRQDSEFSDSASD